MRTEEIEKWKQAGKLAHDALHYGKSLIKNKSSMLQVTEKIEKFVLDNGGKLAFPTNIAINDIILMEKELSIRLLEKELLEKNYFSILHFFQT